MIINKIFQLGEGLARKSFTRSINTYLKALSVFVALLTIPKPLWAWEDYTYKALDNARYYDNLHKYNEIVDEAVKESKFGGQQRPDPRKTERFMLCDNQRQQCTQCLLQPGIDSMACHYKCENEFNQCMAAAVPSSENSSLVGAGISQSNDVNLKGTLLPIAEKGDANAQYMVAVLYYLGIGTERDPDIGWAWLMKSKTGGNETASRLLEKVNGLQISSLLNSEEYMLFQQLYPEERKLYLDKKRAQRDQELYAIVANFLKQEAQQ